MNKKKAASISKATLDAAKSGDQAAMSSIVDDFRHMIIRLVTKGSAIPGYTTEDLAQEARLIVVKCVGKFSKRKKANNGAAFETYVYRAISNRILSIRRDSKPMLSMQTGKDLQAEPTAECGAVMEAVLKLPPLEMSVMLERLRGVSDGGRPASLKNISESLGVAPARVRRAMLSATNKIRNMIGGFE